MTNGRNCTDEALFPHFPTQNIVFAATFGSEALLESVRSGPTAPYFSVCANRDTSQRGLTVENVPRATITR